MRRKRRTNKRTRVRLMMFLNKTNISCYSKPSRRKRRRRRRRRRKTKQNMFLIGNQYFLWVPRPQGPTGGGGQGGSLMKTNISF